MAYGTITIANGATTSSALSVDGIASGIAIELPSALTGTALAIHGTIDGTNYKPIYFDNVALSLTYTASTIHIISPNKLFGIDKIKLVSTGAEGAARTFNVTALKAV